MQSCSIIDQQADSIEFAAGPTLTKTIHDLHKILDPHETPRKTALAQALHGLCLDGWVMPAVNLLPYYPNGSPNDGREQTPPSDILSAFIPQYLRGKCEPSNEACPQESSQTSKDNGDRYPGVPNIKAPPRPANLLEKQNPLCYIGDFPVTLAEDWTDKNGTIWGVLRVNLASQEYQKPRSDRFCPHCGAMGTLGKHSEKTITLVYITVRHKPYRVIVTVPVWRCTKCRSIRREPIPFRFGNTRLTQQVFDDFKAEFTDLHHKGSMHEIALRYHISDQRVAQLLDYINYHSKDAFAIALPIERRRSNITQITECNFLPPDFPINVMLIDEVALRRRDFITIVINPLTRQLLFYAPGRGADAIYKLNEWSNGQIAPDAKVATDMSAVFMATLRKFIPSATFVNDRFHHMRNARRHLNWEIKTVVSLLKAQGRVDDAAFLSDHETIGVLFTPDLGKLNPELKERYDKAIALHERLQLIRDCYIELYMGFESKTIEEARAHMLQHLLICDQLQEIRIAASPSKIKQQTALSDYLIENGLKPKPAPDPGASAPLSIRNAKYNKTGKNKQSGNYCPAARLGNTTLEHLDELLNYVQDRLTTGPIEGFNNLLKVLKRASFGVKRLDRFMCRLKLIYESNFDLGELAA